MLLVRRLDWIEMQGLELTVIASGGEHRYPKYCISTPATAVTSELDTPKQVAAAPTWEMK